MPTSMIIGARDLVDQLRKRGITQGEIGKRVRAHAVSVGRWRRSNKAPEHRMQQMRQLLIDIDPNVSGAPSYFLDDEKMLEKELAVKDVELLLEAARLCHSRKKKLTVRAAFALLANVL